MPTFEEALELTSHHTSLASITSSVQETSADSQLPLVLILSTSHTAEPLHSIQSSTSSAIVVSVEDADLAMLDHKALVPSL